MADRKTTGPEKGALVIVGGGKTPDTVKVRFLDLAGGFEKPILIIPDPCKDGTGIKESFKALGATNVEVLHPCDYTPTEAANKIKSASGIYFSGGRQPRFIKKYGHKKIRRALKEVLANKGVIGGTSAGATILGSYLVRGENSNKAVYNGNLKAFGFIKNIAIDQHFIARNRHFDMFEILNDNPELLGIGIAEGTAIVVQGNQFLVMGDSCVAIYDGQFWTRKNGYDAEINDLFREKPFYFLKAGDRYDMNLRKVIGE